MSSEPYDRLILLPGLGADARMFEAQKVRFPNLEVPDWLTPLQNETLESYGRRFAESLAYNANCFIGGSSFGGMVAAEMSKHITPRKLLLIGSACSFSEVTPLLRAASRLARWMPKSVCRLIVMPTRLTSRLFGLQTDSQTLLFKEMVSAASPEFIRWGIQAMSIWSGMESDILVARLHGTQDRIIPPLNDGSQTLIPGAGHLPTMSHPNEINDWLASVLASS
ncbi:MAG TPA: alpha/beta hydrolase [Planctomycetaceae bacterium]|nr:alpha/beta hydrolase [Planctomycetaceae bacterium]